MHLFEWLELLGGETIKMYGCFSCESGHGIHECREMYDGSMRRFVMILFSDGVVG